MFDAYLKRKRHRAFVMCCFFLLCLASGIVLFALLITALSASGAGALAIPGAFVCILTYEAGRYFFYKSFYMQQLTRVLAWKNLLDTDQL